MEILTELGGNSTLWIQLGCFLIAFVALSQLIFKPYMAAHHERTQRTIGNEEAAGQILQDAAEIQIQYESRARELNDQTKQIFDQTRTAAMQDYDRVVNSARDQAAQILGQSRAEIAEGIKRLQADVFKEVPGVANVIASKLLGKEIVQ